VRSDFDFIPARRDWHFSGVPYEQSQWITVALDGSVPAETIELLLDVSYELTKPKPRRKPVNRKEPDDTKI
jgi:hypothetical protein